MFLQSEESFIPKCNNQFITRFSQLLSESKIKNNFWQNEEFVRKLGFPDSLNIHTHLIWLNCLMKRKKRKEIVRIKYQFLRSKISILEI